MANRPRARTDLRSQDMGTELLLYDAETDRIHILNETAWQVWQLCDGQHTEDEIAEEMVSRYPGVDPDMIRRDALRVTQDFEEKRLLATT